MTVLEKQILWLDKFYLIPYCFSTWQQYCSRDAPFSNEDNFKLDTVLNILERTYKLQSVEISWHQLNLISM